MVTLIQSVFFCKQMPILDLPKKNSVTPLFIAAFRMVTPISVSILLQANANPNLQKKNGVTPLCIAAENGQL